MTVAAKAAIERKAKPWRCQGLGAVISIQENARRASNTPGTNNEGSGALEDAAGIDIVNVEVAAPEPGTTDVGENEQVASVGSPEQVKVIKLLSEPARGATTMVSVAVCPGWIEMVGCIAAIVKSTAWMTVMEAFWVAPPKEPEIVTVVCVDTELLLIVKVADCWPADTSTVAGGSATPGLVLDRVTVAPPLGAMVLNVAVSVTELPPVTV